MGDVDLNLVAGVYADEASAFDGYQALVRTQEDDGFVVIGAIVLTRDADGEVHVNERGASDVEGGATIGAVAGLVLGLFAPPLLLTTAVGAGLGAAIGAMVKRHKEQEMGADLEEFLPLGSSAVVAVVDEAYADRVEHALSDASSLVTRSIDWDDYETIKDALGKASSEATTRGGS